MCVYVFVFFQVYPSVSRAAGTSFVVGVGYLSLVITPFTAGVSDCEKREREIYKISVLFLCIYLGARNLRPFWSASGQKSHLETAEMASNSKEKEARVFLHSLCVRLCRSLFPSLKVGFPTDRLSSLRFLLWEKNKVNQRRRRKEEEQQNKKKNEKHVYLINQGD